MRERRMSASASVSEVSVCEVWVGTRARAVEWGCKCESEDIPISHQQAK
jgi:hypothetical protein